MKYLLLCVVALLATSCSSFVPAEIEGGKILGVLPLQYGRASYQMIYKAPAGREDIFRQVRRWAAFHSSTTIVTSQGAPLKINTPSHAFNTSDNLLGDVISNGNLLGGRSDYRTVMYWPGGSYTTSIECYDGYYRITITNIQAYGIPSPHPVELRDTATPVKKTRAYYTFLDKQIMSLVEELAVFVKTELATNKP